MVFRSYYNPNAGGYKNTPEINNGEIIVDQSAAEEVKDVLEKMMRGERPASFGRQGVYEYDLNKDKPEEMTVDPTRVPGFDIVDGIPLIRAAEREKERLKATTKEKPKAGVIEEKDGKKGEKEVAAAAQ